MSDGTKEFAVSDLEYNIVTTLSNLLQSEEVLVHYTDDAEAAGAVEIAEIFRNLRNSNRDSARDLRNALVDHLKS
jgi:hypothetical protein